MKKVIITIVLTLEALLLSGQSITTNLNVVVGKNRMTGKEIQATKYEFKDRIYKSRLDTTFQTLTLQLRQVKSNGKYYKNKGELAVLDLKSGEIKWSKDINYGNTTIEQYEGVLFWNKGLGSTTRIELTTGKSLWTSNSIVFATIPYLNISLAYKYNSVFQELSKNLSCIDLTTGRVLWERPVDRSYGWYGLENLSDTALIIKSSGLYQVNLKTGKGWNYDAKTGVKDYSKTVGVNAVGAVLGLLTGSFVVSTGHDLVSNLVSNLKMDNLYLYFASKDYLTCLSHEGVVKWTVALPKETSHSTLLLDSTRVILINNGEAVYNGKRCNYGKPYIAVFDRESGTQNNLTLFDLDKNPLLNFIHGKDSLDLLFKDRSIRYSLNDGYVNMTTYDSEEIGDLENTVEMFSTYIMLDSTFLSLHSVDSSAVYLMSNKEKVVKLNKNLGFDKIIPFDEIYSWRTESDKYSFLYHDKKIFVTENLNKVIAELNIGFNIFILDNKLYELNSNTITEIDLDAIF